MTKFAREKAYLEANIASWFPCNTRVVVNANSNPLLSHVEISLTKSRIKSSKQINILSAITQMVIQEDGKYHRVTVW